MNSGEFPWLVAVHGGAGYHSTGTASENAVKQTLRLACTSAIGLLGNEKEMSTGAVEHAMRVLEDDGCLNAGYGSNLTIDGSVECDASIMDGTTRDFGSAGAVQGVKNPISLARAVLQNSTEPQPLGRVPPLTLVGQGATAFASSSGLQLVNSDVLISKNARREWHKWKTRLKQAESVGSEVHEPVLSSSTAPEDGHSILEDTVGAVACDTSGTLAAGVSSGGLLLKYPGRIGEAAVFGAGCWAHSPPGERTGVACSVSGTGEAIIRTSFARTLSEALYAAPPEETHEVLQSKLEAFCEEISSRGQEPNVGVLVITKEPITEDDDDSDSSEDDGSEEQDGSPAKLDQSTSTGDQSNAAAEMTDPLHSRDGTEEYIKLRLWCAFSTESMAVAYASSEHDIPRALILRHRTHRNADGRRDAKRGVHISALPLSR